VSTPKLHHHVPQFYQTGFARDGRVWVFDRVIGSYRCDRPRNIGAITHDYSISAMDGTKDARIEQFLAKSEGAANPILADLRNGKPLTIDEKETFAAYLGYFFLRGPRFQRMVDNIGEIMVKAFARTAFESVDDIREMMADVPNFSDNERASMDYEAMFAFVKSEQYSTRTNREFVMSLMMQEGAKLQNYFRQMNWMVAHSSKATAFLTTDNPLVIVPGARRPGDPAGFRRDGVISEGAIKLFPLGWDACLMMLDHGDKLFHFEMPADNVRLTNIEVVSRCERLVIGRDEEHVRNLVRKTGVDRAPKPPIFESQPIPSG
jgi:hypothetical protein